MLDSTVLEAEAHHSVLIVGAGPVGLSSSIALARHGVDSLLVERRTGPSPYPRSTSVSTRTMQIYRQWGISDEIHAGAIPAIPFIFLVQKFGDDPQILATSGIPQQEQCGPFSPVPATTASLDHVEPVLLKYARTLEGADIQYEVELMEFTQTSEKVFARLLDKSTGVERIVSADYLIASDGAHSPVRKALGVAMQGYGHVEQYRSVLFTTPDLAPIVKDRPAAIIQVLDSEFPGKFMRHGENRWTFGLPLTEELLARGELPDFKTIIRAASGQPNLEPEILKEMTFDLTSFSAQQLRVGRIFLAGDSVHQQTPIGGTGNNAGTHDAVNLAWKLAAVIKGWAGDDLLDSYEAERKPLAERNVTRSISVPNFFEYDDMTIDMGYRVASTAVISERPEEPIAKYTAYSPSGEPGHLAPHAWVRSNGEEFSTVDVADGTFVLFSANRAWAETVSQAAQSTGAPIRVVIVEPWERSVWWHNKFGIGVMGASLVRPDGVVAWRTTTPPAENAADTIEQVLRQVLSLDSSVDGEMAELTGRMSVSA